MSDQAQFGRKATLLVIRKEQRGNNPSAFVPESVIDLSEMHFRFSTKQQDVESPNNCSIRVYNLSEDTVKALTKFEYTRVVLQAGYANAGYGVIFDGTITWFRKGKENATDHFLDILASDGDMAYNFAVVNKTVAAGSNPGERVKVIIDEMAKKGTLAGNIMQFTGGVLPRGKVLFGMARALLRQETVTHGATWSILNGQVNVTPLTGYLPGEAVVLTSLTGLVGIPEQTTDGMMATCLLNPRLLVGGLVKIDNKSINQLIQQNPNAAPIAFNQYTGIQNLATVAADGLYRLYVVEHDGDTRNTNWYTNITALAVNPVTKEVAPYG